MPVLDRRKITGTKQGTFKMSVPKEWADFFQINPGAEVDVVTDLPIVVFPPQVVKKEDRIKALQKIIQLLQITPERPFQIARKGPKKGGKK